MQLYSGRSRYRCSRFPSSRMLNSRPDVTPRGTQNQWGKRFLRIKPGTRYSRFSLLSAPVDFPYNSAPCFLALVPPCFFHTSEFFSFLSSQLSPTPEATKPLYPLVRAPFSCYHPSRDVDNHPRRGRRAQAREEAHQVQQLVAGRRIEHVRGHLTGTGMYLQWPRASTVGSFLSSWLDALPTTIR